MKESNSKFVGTFRAFFKPFRFWNSLQFKALKFQKTEIISFKFKFKCSLIISCISSLKNLLKDAFRASGSMIQFRNSGRVFQNILLRRSDVLQN